MQNYFFLVYYFSIKTMRTLEEGNCFSVDNIRESNFYKNILSYYYFIVQPYQKTCPHKAKKSRNRGCAMK